MSNKNEPVAASLRPPLPPRADTMKVPEPAQAKQWDPTGKWTNGNGHSNSRGSSGNGDPSSLAPLLSPSSSSTSSTSSLSSLSSSSSAGAGAESKPASQPATKAVQFEQEMQFGADQVAPADNVDPRPLISGDGSGKGCKLALPLVSGSRSVGSMSKQCQRQNGIIGNKDNGIDSINHGTERRLTNGADRYDNEPMRHKYCGLSLSLNTGASACACDMPHSAPMFAYDNNNGNCNNNIKIPNAPVAPVSSGGAIGGRPLSQAAVNRAKFAIRSYTIAVSMAWS